MRGRLGTSPLQTRRLLFVAWTLVLACCTQSLGGEDPDSRYRAVILGLAAAAPPRADPTGADGSGVLQQCKKLARKLVREGGLEPGCLRRTLHAGIESIDAEPRALQVYRELFEDSDGEDLEGLLLTVPVSLAYHRQRADALRGGALVATGASGDRSTLLGCGRALTILMHRLLSGESVSRATVLEEVAQGCRSTEVTEAVMRSRTSAPVESIASDPRTALAAVLRAWYRSTSYEDALARLPEDAPPSLRYLTGGLAGATYGVQGIPRGRWPSPTELAELDGLAGQLLDLARDGFLLSVPPRGQWQAFADQAPAGSPAGAGPSQGSDMSSSRNTSRRMLPKDPLPPLAPLKPLSAPLEMSLSPAGSRTAAEGRLLRRVPTVRRRAGRTAADILLFGEQPEER